MFKKRVTRCFAIIFLIGAGLMVRVSYLGASPVLTETAQRQQTWKVEAAYERGAIYDHNFNRLTGNKVVYQAVAAPDISVIDDLTEMGAGASREELAEKVTEGKPFSVTVQSPQTSNENITICQTVDRYSSDSVAVHSVGYLNSDGHGVTGAEKAYDDFLTENAHTMTAVCQMDGKGQFLQGSDIQLEAQGNADAGLVMTLDASQQALVEQACSGIQKGAAIVMDAQTAEIRALASFPSFSPENVAEAVQDEENSPMINRALCTYPVGSTFKIATAACALDKGIPASRTYNCTGSVDVDGQVFHCHHRQGHGTLDMAAAFKESCNPYFITLGQEVGAQDLRRQATGLGFGRSIELMDGVYSAAGTLPPADMSSGELANFSFGQGDLTATLLQVAQMVYAAAGDGKVVAPSLVKGVTEDGATVNEQEPAAAIQAMSEDAAHQIREFMTKTIEGSAAQPQLVSAGGKSATAQTGRKNADGSEEYETWFAGFFPAEQPRYIAVVLIENGKSGTEDAGPVFARIADYLTCLDQERRQ